MHPDNEENTSFYGEMANYYYRTMSFGLKNAEATYQSLIGRVFAKQMGRKREVM